MILFRFLACIACTALIVPCVNAQAQQVALPIVVIDPGHGGNDPGAITQQGIAEKNITLSFAQELKKAIEAAGVARVELTRSQDVYVSIEQRVAIARKFNARLMISLHADSLEQNPFDGHKSGIAMAGNNPNIRGATFYTLSETASDQDAAAYAERENSADFHVALPNARDQTAVNDILAELTTRETRALSTHFAQQLANNLKPLVKLTKIPIRSARFRVLKAPDVPSVLFEMGYLSSIEDTKLLTSEVWRSAVSALIVQSLKSHFAQNTAAR